MENRSETRFLPGSEAEWTGLFLFCVGVFGGQRRSVLRHVTLFGVIPAEYFFMALFLIGGILMLSVGLARAACLPVQRTTREYLFLVVRILVAISLFVVIALGLFYWPR